MSDIMDWCLYFANIEKDPIAITPPITVRQFYEAKNHVKKCNACFQRTERVLAKAPLKTGTLWEKN